MREIVAMLGWLVFYVSLPNEIKLLLFYIFFFEMDTEIVSRS